MKTYLILIALTTLSSCSEEKSSEHRDPESIQKEQLKIFHIYGELASDGYLDSANPITEDYGFKLKRVAGCEIEQELVTQVLKQNNTGLKEMNKKFGTNWMENFTEKTGLKLAIPFN